ncbi:mucin-5AC [Hyalella azteca]|uniref:Mucin-5AC n=1 Tax=Hyalella azteca TaxID=294128 RepID=A0A8B7N4E5_HYAAZ|nr:mucin-5AC [Hyalella azteca]
MVSGVYHSRSTSSSSMGSIYSPTHVQKSNGRFDRTVSYQLYQRGQQRPLHLDSTNLDYSKQLHVETSVEYDLPSHIYPPKDAEPILMIDTEFHRKKKRVKASASTSLSFLAGGSQAGTRISNGTSSTSSTSTYCTRSTIDGEDNEPCFCHGCRLAIITGNVTSRRQTNSSSSHPQPNIPSFPSTSAYAPRNPKGCSIPIITVDSPTLPPAKPTPVLKSTKKSKAVTSVEANIQELHQRYQQYQQLPQPTSQLLYPLPPPSYATATATTNLYAFAGTRTACTTNLCQNAMCTTCTTPMVGAGPPDLVPHAIATAHIVRSRGSPKLRTRRHLPASTNTHLPQYLRRPRANTIGHASTTQQVPITTTTITTTSYLPDPKITTPGKPPRDTPSLLPRDTPSLLSCGGPALLSCGPESAVRGLTISAGRGAPPTPAVPQRGAYSLDTRVGDTAQLYPTPITPADLTVDGDYYQRLTTAQMDTSISQLIDGHTSLAATSDDPSSSITAIMSTMFATQSSDLRLFLQNEDDSSSRYARQRLNPSTLSRNLTSSARNLSSSSRNLSSSSRNISSSARNPNPEPISLQTYHRIPSNTRPDSATSASSSGTSTPSSARPHVMSSVVGPGSPYPAGNYYNSREFSSFFEGNFAAASPHSHSSGSLFAAQPLSHVGNVLGVSTPPQSTIPSTPSTPGSNTFFTTMYSHLNNQPIYNLVY